MKTTYRLTPSGWKYYMNHENDLTFRNKDVGKMIMVGSVARSLGLDRVSNQSKYSRNRSNHKVSTLTVYTSDEIDLAGLGENLIMGNEMEQNILSHYTQISEIIMETLMGNNRRK